MHAEEEAARVIHTIATTFATERLSISVTTIILAPSLAVVLILLVRRARWAEFVNLAASLLVLLAALPLPALSAGPEHVFLNGYIGADPLGSWAVLCAAIVYLLASMYAIGYMRSLQETARLPQFYALFAGFALTTLVGPLMNNAGLYWIAIELTTLVSTFLVAFEREAESIEAAWKYIIVVSGGISLALLGTILFYWAGTLPLGPSYQMTWSVLRDAAPHMNPALMELAFLLVLVGYGTKVGLAPMHTWLPDAHSEGPAPVSALLSGALLNTAMVGIVRYLAIVDSAGLGSRPHAVLIAFGAFSLLLAALFIVRQTGIKRLMAYSSVEHMGVIALGFGFGGPLGIGGALYHMLNHSLNKSLMFFGAGSAMRNYGTKKITCIRGVFGRLPGMAALWLAGAVAITGAPPFGLFASELTILRAGLNSPSFWAAIVMALLLIVIFVGFLNHFRAMYFDPAPSAPAIRVSAWCLAPMWLAMLPLLLFGLWWPEAIWTFFGAATRSLQAPLR